MTLPLPALPRRLAALTASLAAPLLALAALLLSVPAPAQAANIVVTTCTQAGLQAAISTATLSTGNRVTFACPGGAHTFILNQTQTISRDLTIDGGGVITISGGNSARIFFVPSAEKATVLNLTLEKGSASQGAALNVAGLAVITNVTFINNATSGNGGALGVLALGSANVSLSRFYTNTAFVGGAIVSAGGLSVDQSYFFGNSARAAGAIYQPAGAAAVANSTFVSNTSESGGAIETGGSLALVGDEFDHNSTPLSFPVIGQVGGGALFVAPSAHTLVRQSVFFSNTANVGGTSGVGGAILNEGSLIVLDSLFNQNHALDDGGALFNDASAAITQSTFVRNSTLGAGGAISNTGFVTITNSTLVSNTAAGSGGALANTRRIYLLTSLLFNNSAPDGGAARNYAGGALDLDSDTFYSNTALTGAGGAVLNNAHTTAFNSTFAANAAPNGSGGAILSVGSSANQVGLINATVVSNTAASAGAALRRIDGNFFLENSIVAFNTPGNCQGTMTATGPNLQFSGLTCGAGITSTNPLLGPLQDNGGPRIGVLGVGLPTLLPLTGSPALNAGTGSDCPATDQRGYPRVGLCDIGALERSFPVWLPVVEK